MASVAHSPRSTPDPSAPVTEPVAAAETDRPIRSLAKAVSWRVTGSIDTMLLSWLFTGDLRIAAAIGLTEVITKMVLYYVHERAWNRISLGRTGGLQPNYYLRRSDLTNPLAASKSST